MNRNSTGEDRGYSSSVPGDRDPDRGNRKSNVKAREVQPGTGEPGKSWQSRPPVPDDKDDKLNQELKDSFPASDPPQSAQPGVTGWDVKDEKKKKARKA
ncbi:MAG: hypothetical protein ACREV8_14620 [Gammaproteobacteria bacterium]